MKAKKNIILVVWNPNYSDIRYARQTAEKIFKLSRGDLEL